MLNGERAYTADHVEGGELIELFKDPTMGKPLIELNIAGLFEDDHLAVVYKPAGLLVSGNKRWTLENALSQNLKNSNQPDCLTRPEPIHRLDYPTSGALLIGKTGTTVTALNKLFESRNIQKTYIAITQGRMDRKGVIESPIDDKPARTSFEVLQTEPSPKYEALNLVKLLPTTGRRHQLRKHMASLGHPILGDREYGTEGLILKGKGLYLHALQLEFIHPITKRGISTEAPLPKKFLKIFPNGI